MRKATERAIAAATLLAGLFLPQILFAQVPSQVSPRPANSASAAPEVPLTDRQKEEVHARVLMATKQYADAIKIYIHLSQEDPRNASYPNFAGLAYLQLSDLDDAGKYFQRAAKVNKKFAEAFNNIGAVEFARKRYRPAIRQYQKALAIEPQTAGFYGNLAYAYFAEKQYPRAMGAFQKALALDPAAFETSNRNGTLMQYRGVAEPGLFDFMLAKSYAQSGDGPHCAVYLRKAVDEGYKSVATAKTDPAFAKVRANPEVKLVLDPLPTPVKASGTKAPSGL